MKIMGCCSSSRTDEHVADTTQNINISCTSISEQLEVSLESPLPASSGHEVSISGQILPSPPLKIFSFSEMKVATRNFKNDRVLGMGRFGKVFKGWIDEKKQGKSRSETAFAVKELNSKTLQGFEEWQQVINSLWRLSLSHPNLVRLVGYCSANNKLFLVNEYMQKGNLENHLFGRGPPLPWDLRLQIVIGAARGLAFLHSSMNQVIYKEFKTSNILLDKSYTAKISDFGLAKTCTSDQYQGFGYEAPEYIVGGGHPSVKSDVYGFGVVLVEILTGLRVMDTNRPIEQHNLIIWAKPFLRKRGNLKNIMDPRLEQNYPPTVASGIAQLSFKCLKDHPKHRPEMKEVLETLEQLHAVPDGASSSFYTSQSS